MFSLSKWLGWARKEPKLQFGLPLSEFYYVNKDYERILRDLEAANILGYSDTIQPLVEESHQSRAELLKLIFRIMTQDTRIQLASRDYRSKYPSDVQEELSSECVFFPPLLYGAEVKPIILFSPSCPISLTSHCIH
eukprot:Sdes_comp24908_c0_seq1m22590